MWADALGVRSFEAKLYFFGGAPWPARSPISHVAARQGAHHARTCRVFRFSGSASGVGADFPHDPADRAGSSNIGAAANLRASKT